MNVKKIALLLGALVIAVVTAVMAKNMFVGAGAEQASAAPAVPLGPKVLVARKALPVGTIIDAESLAYQPWPKELVQSAISEAILTRNGQTPRHGGPLQARRPAVTNGAPRRPNDRGFLAAALGPGMRAARFRDLLRRRRLRFPRSTAAKVLTQKVKGGARHAAKGFGDDRAQISVSPPTRIDARVKTAKTWSRTSPRDARSRARPEKIAVCHEHGSLTRASFDRRQ